MDDDPIWSKIQRTMVETILVDLDLELTFLESAELASDERRRRNAEHAARACHQMSAFLPRCSPTNSQLSEINDKLEDLKTRLNRLGYEVIPRVVLYETDEGSNK